MAEKGKNPVGRPHKYSSAEEMQAVIDDFFDNECVTEYHKDSDGKFIYDKYGRPIVKNINAPSVVGLALHLGYADRRSVYDNEDNPQFSHIIKKAKSKVEYWVYQHALDGSIPPAVGIFILKQFGYTDKQDLLVDMAVSDAENLTDEERKARITKLQNKLTGLKNAADRS